MVSRACITQDSGQATMVGNPSPFSSWLVKSGSLGYLSDREMESLVVFPPVTASRSTPAPTGRLPRPAAKAPAKGPPPARPAPAPVAPPAVAPNTAALATEAGKSPEDVTRGQN